MTRPASGRRRALRQAPSGNDVEEESTLAGPAKRRRGHDDDDDGCGRKESETVLVPRIRRYVITSTSYIKVAVLERLKKFALSSDLSNTIAFRIATEVVPDDNADAYQPLTSGDVVLWESTKPGEALSMAVYVRLESAGSSVLYIWSWS